MTNTNKFNSNEKGEKKMAERNSNETTKYFVATIKGGHVKRSHYIVFWHYLKATSLKEAAEKCKTIPRGKKDHKDMILDLKEVSYEEFLRGREEELKDPYLNCKNKQEQDQIYHLIEDRIVPDPHYKESMPKEKRKHYNCENNKKGKSKKSYTNRYTFIKGDWDYEYAIA